MILKRSIATFTILVVLYTVHAQVCPSVSFEIPSEACLNENIDFNNNSAGAITYEWDLCSRDLMSSPTASLVIANRLLDFTFDIELQQSNGNWYGFTVSRSSGQLIRLDFGTNLDSDPSLISLGTYVGFNDPNALAMEYFSGNWYAVVGNVTGADLVVLEFGSNLASTPTSFVQANVTNGSRIDDVEIQIEDNHISAYVLGRGSNNLIYLDFGESFANTPIKTDFQIAGASGLTSLSITRECDSFYGLLSSFDDNSLYSVSFGTNISNASNHSVLSSTINSPAQVELLWEGGLLYGWAMELTGSLIRLEYGVSFTNTPVISDVGNLDVLPGTMFGLAIADDSSTFIGFAIDFVGDNIYRFLFPNECSASLPKSGDFEPKEVNYSTSGRKYISLKSTDLNGDINYYLDSMDVSEGVAASITFKVDGSLCLENPKVFTSSTNGTLLTYSWDFNDDGVEDSNLENPTFDYTSLGAGTYTVRLDVTDGTCDNFIEQQITLLPEPETPTFTSAVSASCPGEQVAFSSTVDAAPFAGNLTYEWDFNGEGTSTAAAPSFAFESPGMKEVTLTTRIPGCEAVSTPMTIEVFALPTPAFTASTVCEDDLVSFIDASSNAVSYLWDFGDGFTSNVASPDHLYEGAGFFEVSLTTTNANGCDNTIQQEVFISPKPEVAFSFDIPCDGTLGTSFQDLSTVLGADLVQWSWQVDGEVISTDQSPTLAFDTPGAKTIALEVTSSNGCVDRLEREVTILSSPVPDFAISLGCDGETSFFTDQTSSGGTDLSYLWTIEDAVYTSAEVAHQFSGAGLFDVTLQVTGANLCASTLSQTVEILPLPAPAFSYTGSCTNEVIEAADFSTSASDAIVERRWLLDEEVVGNGDRLVLAPLPAGNYDLSLAVDTQNGCTVVATETLVIEVAPIASFTEAKRYGVPDELFTFTNTSDGASSRWLLDGEEVSTNAVTQELRFSAPGTYRVGLEVTNNAGCVTLLEKEVLIATPAVDLSISDFELFEDGTEGIVTFDLQNNSNLPVDQITAVISLENAFSFSVPIEEFIDIGASKAIRLDVTIPVVQGPAFFCVEVSSQYEGFADLNPLDNKQCTAIEPSIVVEEPFPNPVSDEARLEAIFPEAGSVQFSIINAAGKVELVTNRAVAEGLNTFFFDVASLSKGIYFIRMVAGDDVFTRKIIKF